MRVGLIRKEIAVSDTTVLSEDEIIDPVTGEIIDQKNSQNACSSKRKNRA